MNRAAVIAGSIRALSGVSFLVAPERAQLLWSQREASDPTARLLLRSMGYRDLLIGAGLIAAGVRDEQKVPGWFLASAGADAADLIGGLSVRDELPQRDHLTGIGGAAVGMAVGIAGAVSAFRSARG
ncbi:MAG: DUF4267 domain-containing protein [Acidimicrobiales bacterium]|jgi:hypothetical protein|nr:DUF4267 domain-containing protein [Acidimicrobiales bacterium]